MGVYARKHAQQVILDLAQEGERSPLSPRAQLLFLHIAQHFAGDENDRRDVQNGELWDGTKTYFEGLGKKARAIGYNVPEKIDVGTVFNEEMTEPQVRAVKAAVQKATKELVDLHLLEQVRRGQTGQNAAYSLDFLNRSCSLCRFEKDGERYMDQTKHLPQAVRDAALERADDWSHKVKKPSGVTFPKATGWGAPSEEAPWDKPDDGGWGKPF